MPSDCASPLAEQLGFTATRGIVSALRRFDADVVVVGLIGERAREVTDFIETRLSASMMPRSVVVAVPADHPPLMRLRAAMRATAIAEHFRHEGKRVLLLLDSLTRVAHAQREIGLALGEPPTMKGYPPSALGLIPGLVERAGCDVRSGGSITALYTVLADGGDNDDPVVDTARAIADGHFVLSRALSEQAVFPALDVGKSGTRKEELLVEKDKLTKMWVLRRILMQMGTVDAMEFLLDKMKDSKTNEDFFATMNQ